MKRRAGRVKKNLSDIAIIDQPIIELIIDQLPPAPVELTPEQIAEIASQVDISGKVDKVTGKSLVEDTEILNIHAPGSDNQDLSGLQPKETGKGLSTNDFTTVDKSKLDGLENYVHPTNHSASIITQDANNRFTTDTEKLTWNSKESGNSNIQAHVTAAHAPADAQKNSNILKSEIEAVLTGELSSHSHAGGGGGLSQQQIEGIL